MKDKKYILFLSTYPPRACGIATFTQDLVNELQKTEKFKIGIVAVTDTQQYTYPSEVVYEFSQQSADAYGKAAEWINESGASLLVIEHEYGIYGGKDGNYLTGLIKKLAIPYDVTLHTVLPKPTANQNHIIHTLATGCLHLITMSPHTVSILQDTYGIAPEKITVIHHGVPEIPVADRKTLKHESGYDDRFVVSTFGLLSPGKGLEYGIQAIAQVSKEHPEILYFILGRTHPVVQKKYGEKYRSKLENLVRQYKIEENVRFINKYLSKEEIIRYLKLSDIYMTPYLGKDQAVSGTLAYAVGYGRVIVSTPYLYAQGMLAEGRGLLANFRDAESLASCISFIIQNPAKKTEIEEKIQILGNEMRWGQVAKKYLSVFTGDIG